MLRARVTRLDGRIPEHHSREVPDLVFIEEVDGGRFQAIEHYFGRSSRGRARLAGGRRVVIPLSHPDAYRPHEDFTGAVITGAWDLED